ncbi:MAG: UvrY/SirA/GacA family response regulator transcription factor [Gammaproteobacteria bacterium]|nr:UvrY/SirA/GacA family response regulator transcription factor [Gammaproteobacteria bacterium]
MIKVFIVDDQNLIRTGIKKLLSDIPGIKVIGEAADGENAIKMLKDHEPHIVLMDIKMPGMGGLEATKKILRTYSEVKIIALTVCEDDLFPSRLLQAGAYGYLTKGASVPEMVKAIRSVYAGQRYISPEIASQLAIKHITDQGETPFDTLSERELQVALMIVNGHKVQEISDKLCLSPKTVNSYRYRIFEKLNIKSDVELTHLAFRHNLLDQVKE